MDLTRGQLFVNMFEAAITDTPSLENQLLLKYFKENVDLLPVDADNPTAFHKAFRVQDVCPQGWKDMVIWSLISGGACFEIWGVLEEFYNVQS